MSRRPIDDVIVCQAEEGSENRFSFNERELYLARRRIQQLKIERDHLVREIIVNRGETDVVESYREIANECNRRLMNLQTRLALSLE